MSQKIINNQAIGGKRIKPPELVAPVSTDHLNPVFCFKYLDKKYGLSKCKKEEKASLVDKLHTLSQLSWREISSTGRHQNGTEKIPRTAIHGKIPEWITEDIDSFIAFRFDGLKPMVGHRKGQIFHIFWIDRDFTLYNHN